MPCSHIYIISRSRQLLPPSLFHLARKFNTDVLTELIKNDAISLYFGLGSYKLRLFGLSLPKSTVIDKYYRDDNDF